MSDQAKITSKAQEIEHKASQRLDKSPDADAARNTEGSKLTELRDQANKGYEGTTGTVQQDIAKGHAIPICDNGASKDNGDSVTIVSPTNEHIKANRRSRLTEKDIEKAERSADVLSNEQTGEQWQTRHDKQIADVQLEQKAQIEAKPPVTDLYGQSYAEGLKAILSTAKSEQEATEKVEKFQRRYDQRKECEYLTAKEQGVINLRSVAQIQPVIEETDVEPQKVIVNGDDTTTGDGKLLAKGPAPEAGIFSRPASDDDNNPWEAFRRLTPEQQKAVIRAIKTGSQTGQDEYRRQAAGGYMEDAYWQFVNCIRCLDHWIQANLGSESHKEQVKQVVEKLNKIAHDEKVGKQEPTEKAATLGAGVVIKTAQGVDQVGQHLHPRAFVKDTHEAAEAMRHGIGKAVDYYGEKIQKNDLDSVIGDTIDATKHAAVQTGQAIKEFPNKNVSEQSKILGVGATASVFFLVGKQIMSSAKTAKVLGVEESALTDASEKQLATKGLRKIPKHELPLTKEGKPLQFSEESGIQLMQPRPGQDKLWEQPPMIRGEDAHVGLGENLPHGTKTIDRVVIKDGIAESIKSIDPRLDSYRDPVDFKNKLNEYVRKLEFYEGQRRRRGGFQMKEYEIDQKVLHLGIPDGALTTDHVKVLDDIGREVMRYNQSLPVDKAPIQIKITVLK